MADNLAATLGQASYNDCDVEEPNGRLFLKPVGVTSADVCTMLPQFDLNKCDGCRKCVDFCRVNALVFIKKQPRVFSEVCHACGGCGLVCPQNAVREIERPVGVVERGRHGDVNVVTGILNVGEGSGVPVIKAAMETGIGLGEPFTVIDCPPGSACSVMECVDVCDACLLVAEPTAFGFHNFKMVYELATLLQKSSSGPYGSSILLMTTAQGFFSRVASS